MLGNVWEWCLDEYDATQAHEDLWTGNPGARVLRGGAFDNNPAYCRCAFRNGLNPSRSFSYYGFRVAVGVDVSRAESSAPSGSSAAVPREGGILAPPETRVTALTTNPKVGEVFTLPLGGNVTMELMGIPPGEFLMGSTKEEQAWAVANGLKEESAKREGEAPRKATIKQGFWLGRTEVTVGQWKQFVAATGYQSQSEKFGQAWCYDKAIKTYTNMVGKSWMDPNFGATPKESHPVSCISWNDAVAFCGWLTAQERKAGRLGAGQVVRLPKEAEWEYACRAGSQTKFWWGDSPEEGKDRLNWGGTADGFQWVSPVDQYGERGRNGFGLADMLGNVYEWCLDEYDAKQAHEECYQGNPDARALRGGSFYVTPAYCRCANRTSSNPSYSPSTHGFRVVVGSVR
jgi:formylglycine-generating enzyme required for sulfatase activity